LILINLGLCTTDALNFRSISDRQLLQPVLQSLLSNGYIYYFWSF